MKYFDYTMDMNIELKAGEYKLTNTQHNRDNLCVELDAIEQELVYKIREGVHDIRMQVMGGRR